MHVPHKLPGITCWHALLILQAQQLLLLLLLLVLLLLLLLLTTVTTTTTTTTTTTCNSINTVVWVDYRLNLPCAWPVALARLSVVAERSIMLAAYNTSTLHNN